MISRQPSYTVVHRKCGSFPSTATQLNRYQFEYGLQLYSTITTANIITVVAVMSLSQCMVAGLFPCALELSPRQPLGSNCYHIRLWTPLENVFTFEAA